MIIECLIIECFLKWEFYCQFLGSLRIDYNNHKCLIKTTYCMSLLNREATEVIKLDDVPSNFIDLISFEPHDNL